MWGRTGIWRHAIPALVLLAPAALAQQAPPERIGPVRDFRQHQPNPVEVEARERARGVAPQGQSREAQEVDQLYRSLTGSGPRAPPQSTRLRDADRR